jgi:hypothetical protein
MPEALSVQIFPGSFLGDEPPTLKFRALLTEGEAKVRFYRESTAGLSEPYL